MGSGAEQKGLDVVRLDLEGSLNHLEARFHFDYDESETKPVTNPALERSAVESLTEWGFSQPGRNGKMVLKDRQGILRFHAHGFPKLDPGWEITTGERFEHAAKQVAPVSAAFDFRGAGEDWFDVSLEFATATGGRRDEQHRLLLADGLRVIERMRKWATELEVEVLSDRSR